MTAPAIATGIYRHYKGRRYRVLGVVRHSETSEWLVLYQALYGDHGLWVRPIGMFAETVQVDGLTQPRFAIEEACPRLDDMLSRISHSPDTRP